MESYLHGLDNDAQQQHAAGDEHEDANNGQLDLLINAMSNPGDRRAAAQRQAEAGRTGSVADPSTASYAAGAPSDAQHDMYTHGEHGAQGDYQPAPDHRPYTDFSMLEQDGARAHSDPPPREASHSIQGLLAASRMLGNNQQGDLGNAVASSSRISHASRHHRKRRAMSPPAAATRPDPFAEARRATLEQRRRHQKIARLFAATTGPNGARIPEQSMSFSTITLSHGHVAQKSYGPEKRFLAPPPVVRMNGSIADTIDTMTLSLVNHDTGPLVPLISNVQGVTFSIPHNPVLEAEARSMVRDGMGFPALYASQTHKAKAIKLRLNVFQPGGTEFRTDQNGLPILPERLNTGDGLPIEERVQPKFDKKARKAAGNRPAKSSAESSADSKPYGDFVIADINLPGQQDEGMLDPSIQHGAGTPGMDGDDNMDQSRLVTDMNLMTADQTVRPWASFESKPLSILSKPTKATSNSRTLGPPLTTSSTVALWSRINSQAVRTKYMLFEGPRMIGRPSEWSAFVIDVIKRGTPPPDSDKGIAPDDENVLTHSSIVSLRERATGLRTEPLLMCKVNNGELQLNHFGPVHQLEKVAFAKVVNGCRWYLRAPGRELAKFDESGKLNPRIRKRVKTNRDTTNDVVKRRLAPALDQEEQDEDGPSVKFALPKIQVVSSDSQEVRSEFLDDFLCWSINGVTEQTYTFFEGRHDLGDFSTVFKKPLTPLPTLLEDPTYRASDHTVTLTTTDFLYDDDDLLFRSKPLLVYLGAIGPLRVRTYRSVAPAAPGGDADVPSSMGAFPAVPIDGLDDIVGDERPYSAVPSDSNHFVIVINLPAAVDIWEATRIERERAMELDAARGADDDIMDADDMANFDENRDFDVGPPTSTSKPAVASEDSQDAGAGDQDGDKQDLEQQQQHEDNSHEEYVVETGQMTMHPGIDPQQNEHEMGVQHSQNGLQGLQDMGGAGLQELAQQHHQSQADANDVMRHFLDPELANLPDMDSMSGDYIASFEAAAAALTAAQDQQNMHDIEAAAAAAAAMMQTETSLADAHSAIHQDMLGGGGTSSAGEEQRPHPAILSFQPRQPGDPPLPIRKARQRLPGTVPGRKGRPPKPKAPVPVDDNGKRIRKKRELPAKPVLEPHEHADDEPPRLRVTDKALGRGTNAGRMRERVGDLGHSSLPLLFVRPSDGTGYHSGKNVVIDKVELEAGEGWLIRVV